MKSLKRMLYVTIISLLSIFMLIGCSKSNDNIQANVKVADYSHINMEDNNSDLSEQEYILKYLLDNSDVKNYSQEDVDNYIKSLNDYYIEYSSYLGVDLKTYIKDYLKQTEEEFNANAKNSAIEYVKTKNILLTIANKENIKLTDEDYELYLNKLLEQTSYNSLEDFKNNIIIENQEEEMKEAAFFDKIINYIINENKN